MIFGFFVQEISVNLSFSVGIHRICEIRVYSKKNGCTASKHSMEIKHNKNRPGRSRNIKWLLLAMSATHSSSESRKDWKSSVCFRKICISDISILKLYTYLIPKQTRVVLSSPCCPELSRKAGSEQLTIKLSTSGGYWKNCLGVLASMANE